MSFPSCSAMVLLAMLAIHCMANVLKTGLGASTSCRMAWMISGIRSWPSPTITDTNKQPCSIKIACIKEGIYRPTELLKSCLEQREIAGSGNHPSQIFAAFFRGLDGAIDSIFRAERLKRVDSLFFFGGCGGERGEDTGTLAHASTICFFSGMTQMKS